MSRINTNVPALQGIRQLQVNHADLSLRLQRLSTGLRINRGADDPAGLIVSETLRSEIAGTRQAIDNSNRANNVIAVTEGAMNEVSTLLLELESLVVATANTAGLTEEEVQANQLAVDSVLASIDRIGQTTSFGSRRLLDGSRSYLQSGVPPSALASVALYKAYVPVNASRTVRVRVTQSAQVAQVSYLGTTVGGASTTSATTIEIRGPLGRDLFSFASGTSLVDVQAAINGLTGLTGISAVVSSPSVGTAPSALVLSSLTLGSEAFVSVTPINGNFIEGGTDGLTRRATGVDAGVLIDGQTAQVRGLVADVRSTSLDARLHLTPTFGQTLSSATFHIAGGGAQFQVTPRVNPNGQLFVGLERIATTALGNKVTGLLYTLRSGEANSLTGGRFQEAQEIVGEAIQQVASYRGRLGTIQKNHLEPNINSQGVAVENLSASESVIRDADMAAEVSALTRAEILVESTQFVLGISNSVPRFVLSLLS